MKRAFILFVLTIASCKNEGSFLEKSKEVFNSSATYLDSNLIKRPIKYFDDRKLESDSLDKKRIQDYYAFYKKKYPEYTTVYNWFQSKPVYLDNQEGNFYKIISSVVQEGKDIVRKNHEKISANGTYKYFYETEDYFFIYDLKITNSKVTCEGIRRIGRGMGSESMYDLFYDEKGILQKEVFQADVDPDFYESDDAVFFEFSTEVGNKELVNTINLGKPL
ncbi:hypothetical protein [Leeuwenhoekiella sp. NPDC079379]|uniref:hypothetical protein n=1 Tax=Leeuwenhoekiella sp. NPDC079379 TaxID=3364122 RepID=UPI0037C8674C